MAELNYLSLLYQFVLFITIFIGDLHELNNPVHVAYN